MIHGNFVQPTRKCDFDGGFLRHHAYVVNVVKQARKPIANAITMLRIYA